MFSLIHKIYRRIIPEIVTFSSLSENGERVDIDLCAAIDYIRMDMYQKSHFKRYLFAKKFVTAGMVCGDFACGSGYGSALLAEVAKKVVGVDIKQLVVDTISKRYAAYDNLDFFCHDLRTITFDGIFDVIVSFETIEHVEEHEVTSLYNNYFRALKNGGLLIFSTPYLQKKSPEAIEMGFHHTFDINESKIESWLEPAGFTAESFFYQNYKSHEVVSSLKEKDFIICLARKATKAE